MASKARLFYSKELKSGIISKLSRTQSHYIKNVMRLKPGSKISLFNFPNGEWDASILAYDKDIIEFKVEKVSRIQEQEDNLWLAFSPIKKIPQDMMIQKTTELGIQKFIPLLCERSVVRELNVERAEKIIIEASEQSNRISVPKILKIQKLENFLKTFPENGYLVFCDINSKSSNLKSILSNKNPACILIGPEGDFSENERQLIVDHKKTISISLAKNILRAETAAIAATTILSYHLNFK
ncbi:MAG: RNA methyltransferase [Candidatus Marinimicrobia bacterium]|nr:RNA methyltransferase [Candidatus Neomarinimicrobiota bacterium]RPG05379.1 MAG: 16S rRNA (uracil(1498)-N(3))-methyltransferase [Pelagibacteraceae bacterium TMED247]|tara:strand:+ start:2471 stop:3190 length:720 start_codon:yes stop_codon:yes gene_type:complete